MTVDTKSRRDWWHGGWMVPVDSVHSLLGFTSNLRVLEPYRVVLVRHSTYRGMWDGGVYDTYVETHSMGDRRCLFSECDMAEHEPSVRLGTDEL